MDGQRTLSVPLGFKLGIVGSAGVSGSAFLKYGDISSGGRSLDSTLTLSLFSVGLPYSRNPKLLRAKTAFSARCISQNRISEERSNFSL